MVDKISYETVEIEVPASMLEAIDGAIVRLNGLHPDLDFVASAESITFKVKATLDQNQIKSEAFNAVYREAILLKTNDIRSKIIG